MGRLIRCLVAAALLAMPAARGLAADGDLEARVRAIVEDERARWGTPGISVAVIQDGRVAVLLAAGFADREAGTPMALDTQVPAASISKLFTAALVMREVERGRLRLDDPANRTIDERYWIRDASGEPVDATLRQLLSHHAGLPVSWSGIAHGDDPAPTMEAHLAQGQRTIHAPGEHVVYANDGFTLAGFVAGQAEGLPFAQLAERDLLDPLGMTHSTWESPRTLAGGKLAAAYGGILGGSRRTVHDDPTPNAPAGALITTAPDLARFALMLLGGGELDGVRFLQPASIAEMWRLQATERPSLHEGFGLGFGVRERSGRKMVWWDGSLAGAANRFALLPEHQAGAIVLTNLADNAASSETASRILALLVPVAPEQYEPKPADLARVAGTYRAIDIVDPAEWFLGYAMALTFTPRDGTLWQSSRLTKESALVSIGPDRFRMQGSMLDDAEILFDGDEVILGFVRARRIPFWQTPTALAVYAGVLALALLAALGWGVVRLARRLRGRRSAQRRETNRTRPTRA
jgi:CubicO group peptidase (beta-lactamase class C family)